MKFQMCLKEVSRSFQGCSKKVFRVLQGFQGSFKNDGRVTKRSSKVVSMEFQENLK